MEKKEITKRIKRETRASKHGKLKQKFKLTIDRKEEEKKNLHIKLNRVIGQLNGVKKMIEDGRESEDLLMQLCAVESGLETIKFLFYKEIALKDLVCKNDDQFDVSLEELFRVIRRY